MRFMDNMQYLSEAQESLVCKAMNACESQESQRDMVVSPAAITAVKRTSMSSHTFTIVLNAHLTSARVVLTF